MFSAIFHLLHQSTVGYSVQKSVPVIKMLQATFSAGMTSEVFFLISFVRSEQKTKMPCAVLIAAAFGISVGVDCI